MKTRKNKVVIVGAGNVGESIAFAMMTRKIANDIVLIDLNEARAEGDALDLGQGASLYEQISIRQGGYEECADANLIVITAGIARKPGQTRLELAKVNVSIVRSITQEIMKHADNPMILVVSNPADIITAVVQNESGLPVNRVIGSGTSLDTARFRYFIANALDVNITDVNAYILGEHGDSQVPMWSTVNVAGIPLEDFLKQTGKTIDKEDIAKRTREGGADIIKRKGATFLGIAMASATIVENILNDENAVLPVAHVLGKEFGNWAGTAISLPCIVNGDGIKTSLEIRMTDEEKEAMEKSVKTLHDFQKQVIE